MITSLRISAVLLVAAVLAAAGCSSSTSPEDSDAPLYPARTSPDSVLVKLRLAHERRDVAAYLDCLAEDFVFYLSIADCAQDSTLPDFWDRAHERDVAEAMFDAAGIVDSIFIDLTTLSAVLNPGPDPQDPADDLWEHQEDVDLEVVTDDGSSYFSTDPVEFDFQRDLTTQADGDSLWEIIEWRDLGATCPDSCGVVYSWTAIKLIIVEPDST